MAQAKSGKRQRVKHFKPKRMLRIVKRVDFVCDACKNEITARQRRETALGNRYCHTCANKIRGTWRAPKPKPVAS